MKVSGIFAMGDSCGKGCGKDFDHGYKGYNCDHNGYRYNFNYYTNQGYLKCFRNDSVTRGRGLQSVLG